MQVHIYKYVLFSMQFLFRQIKLFVVVFFFKKLSFFLKNKLNVLGLEAIKLDVNVKYNSKDACNITLAYCSVVITVPVSAGAAAMKLHGNHWRAITKIPFSPLSLKQHGSNNCCSAVCLLNKNIFFIVHVSVAGWSAFHFCFVFHTPSSGTPVTTAVRKVLACFTNFTHFLSVQEKACPEQLLFTCWTQTKSIIKQ